MPPTSPIEKLFDMNPCSKRLISRISSIITSIDPQNMEHIREAWQNELGREFTEQEWDEALNQVHSSLYVINVYNRMLLLPICSGCAKLGEFWRQIFDSYKQIYGIPIIPDPLMGIFGVAPEGIVISNDTHSVIAFTTLASHLRLFCWKRPEPPTHRSWLKVVMSYIQLEKIKYTTRGSKRKLRHMVPFY